jgi:hypothetical protein
MRLFTAPILALVFPALLAAQQGQEGHGPTQKVEGGGVFPPGWSARVDDGSPTQVAFAVMAPGWHATTATSTILYRDQDRASGTYEVSSKMHLFPEGPGHREAFGLFLGGKDLQGAGESYTYFLIRGDGTFKLKRRAGASATDITKGWTPSAAIVKSKADGSVANALSVAVGKDKVSFRVNGQEVYSAPAASVDTDGIVGLRINHNLSIHVESLDLKKQ